MSDTITRLQENREEMDRVLVERYDAITAAREDGQTWARIGEALGLTMQAAHSWYNGTPATRRGQR